MKRRLSIWQCSVILESKTMFQVFTTAEVVDRFAESFGVHECDWLDILALQKRICYSGRPRDWEENPNDPWFIVSQAGLDLINESDFIDSIREHPENVLAHPDSAFILDVDDDFASKVEEQYGVICQPVKRLFDFCQVSLGDSKWILRKDENRLNEQDGVRKCWKDILDGDKSRYPSNDMILIDRNFFADINNKTGELIGVEGLVDLLGAILPTSLECEYHILIVYESGKHPDSTTDREIDFIDQWEMELNDIVREIRDFSIKVELLAVNRPNKRVPNSMSYYHKQLFNQTHNRRAVTNYYLFEADFSIAPFFYGVGPRAAQTIRREFLFSRYKEIDRRDLGIKEKEGVIKLVEALFAEDEDCRDCRRVIKNRLIQ